VHVHADKTQVLLFFPRGVTFKMMVDRFWFGGLGERIGWLKIADEITSVVVVFQR
jgi:hypothetical protein